MQQSNCVLHEDAEFRLEQSDFQKCRANKSAIMGFADLHTKVFILNEGAKELPFDFPMELLQSTDTPPTPPQKSTNVIKT